MGVKLGRKKEFVFKIVWYIKLIIFGTRYGTDLVLLAFGVKL